MRILLNDEIDPCAWNGLAGDKVFHRYEWREVIEASYGLRPTFLMAEDGGEYALYPSFQVGKRCISVPYTYIAGPIANSERMQHALLERIRQMGLAPSYKRLVPARGDGQVTAIVHIDDLVGYRAALSQNMRNQLKKADRQGFVLQRERTADSFYPVYCRKMHRHGTPPHKKAFFGRILQQFPQAEIYTAYYEGNVAASMLTIRGEDALGQRQRALFVMWAASDEQWDAAYANYFLYWSVIKLAVAEGIVEIDLGTTLHGSSQYAFKSKWRPTIYSVAQSGVKAASYKESGLLRIISQAWRHLPLSVATGIGPYLRKYLT
ncbi:MAG: GNAT family N-acetyltransferase [Betaproteobacteria bacterium]|nr:GNAT family N-acetyltransferase [Betaproteobacteria bacterium]